MTLFSHSGDSIAGVETDKSPPPLMDSHNAVPRAVRCLTPTDLYTDVNGGCDTLVIDDHHQFVTLTIQRS